MDIEDDSDEYVEQTRLQRSLRNSRHSKRRKTEIQDDSSSEEIVVPEVSFEPLLDEIEDLVEDEDGSAESDYGFESVVSELLPEYLQTRKDRSMEDLERDDFGVLLRRLTRSEITSIIDSHSERADTGSMTVPEAIALRKLKVERERRRASLPSPKILAPPEGVVEGIENISSAPPDPETVDALAAIRKTPYESSFASRLYGLHARTLGVIYVDWDTKTPWMDLMEDIREHYQLLHPNRDPVNETRSAIMYTSLQSAHLDQVHDLLTRSFWQGIDVSDSLEHSPEKCTVVASYNKLVVGVAIMSSPRETYITYLAVRHGWDNSNIATTMLYHLVTLNPGKDITLHVSANNPAMLLYNRFGFKSEEFIVGFYDAYLDPESRASKNAVRLRLRHH